MTRLLRYGLASLGPIGSAGAQFLLSLVLLRAVPAGEFGSFSFLLITSQLAQGVWSALFCAPLLVMVAHAGDGRAGQIRAIFAVNLALAGIVGALLAAIGLALQLGLTAALLFGAFASVSLVRWLGRAHAYASGKQLRAVASDLAYTGVLLAGLVPALRTPHHALEIVCGALLVGAALGLLPLGGAFLRPQFGAVSPRDLRDYAPVWREYSGWSLIGVVTTEATANCHAYIVTLLYGPSAFAVIAATALVIRPVTVGTNALVDLERAQMAREIGERRLDAIGLTMRLFRAALLLIWAVTALMTLALFAYRPGLVFPAHYAPAALRTGAMLWLAVAVARVLRAPDSALLQAAGAFRPLAFASVYACGFSIAAVLLMLAIRDPLWSILGILAGELAFAGWTWRIAQRWLKGALASGPQMGPPMPAAIPPGLLRERGA